MRPRFVSALSPQHAWWYPSRTETERVRQESDRLRGAAQPSHALCWDSAPIFPKGCSCHRLLLWPSKITSALVVQNSPLCWSYHLGELSCTSLPHPLSNSFQTPGENISFLSCPSFLISLYVLIISVTALFMSMKCLGMKMVWKTLKNDLPQKT